MRLIKLLVLLVAPLALFPGLYAMWVCGVTLYEEAALRIAIREAKHWPTTEAHVEWARSVPAITTWYPWPNRVHCRFRYTAGGREFAVEQNRFSNHYSFMSTSHAIFCARLASGLPDAPKQYCHVNPADPSQAMLTASFDDANLGMTLSGACFGLLLGLGMLSVGALVVLAAILWNFRPDAGKGAPRPTRFEADVSNGRVVLPLAAWFTLSAIPMAVLTAPAVLRNEAGWGYWIPMGIAAAVIAPLWFVGLRRRRAAPLVQKSWLDLDGHPINARRPPAGRLYLSPTDDPPDEISLRYELVRVAGKHSNTLWKHTTVATRQQPISAAAHYCLEPMDTGMSEHHMPASPQVAWSIRVRGVTRGRKFQLLFVRFLTDC